MDFKALSNEHLLEGLPFIIGGCRYSLAQLVGYLAEVHARRLFERGDYRSLNQFCVHSLKMSESEASRRCIAARLAARFPIIIDMLKRGDINLAVLHRLRAVLTRSNHLEILTAAAHKSVDEVSAYLEERVPRGKSLSSIRRLPRRRNHADQAQAVAGVAPTERDLGAQGGARQDSAEVLPTARATPKATRAPYPHSRLEPTAPNRYKVVFTADEELLGLLNRARALLGDDSASDFSPILKEALKALLERLERSHSGEVLPANSTQPILPVDVELLDRDPRCTFVDDEGRRCNRRVFLIPAPAADQTRSCAAGHVRMGCRAHHPAFQPPTPPVPKAGTSPPRDSTASLR